MRAAAIPLESNIMILRLVLFLLLNFGALALGGIFAGKGAASDWYLALDKAPWTPPGWVFGFAWTSIMVCFSLWLAYLWPSLENKSLFLGLYALQWVLNVGWNPVFFHYHRVLPGLVVIVLLTLLVAYFLFRYQAVLRVKSLLLLPYFLWLLIATSLNAYIWVRN